MPITKTNLNKNILYYNLKLCRFIFYLYRKKSIFNMYIIEYISKLITYVKM